MHVAEVFKEMSFHSNKQCIKILAMLMLTIAVLHNIGKQELLFLIVQG